jgi:hypothetical protein
MQLAWRVGYMEAVKEIERKKKDESLEECIAVRNVCLHPAGCLCRHLAEARPRGGRHAGSSGQHRD